MRGRITTIFICVSALLLLANCAFSQTKVNGKIVDANTKEPLPFVNILFKGTKVGTTSDFDGNYSMECPAPVDSIVATYIGYSRTAIKVKRYASQTINILMSTAGVELPMIELNAGENPAHRILRKVIAHKPQNDREKLSAYQYETYNKLEFDLNNISNDFKNRKIIKPVKFIFDNIDSSDKTQKPYLPIFITETLSDFYYCKDPKSTKEFIKASKVSGVKNSSISQFLGDMYLNLNIYDNNIILFSKGFASPVSDNGLFFYKYYLIDSLFIGNHWCYQLKFKPRRRQELCFEGNMWIADTTFAIRRIEMSIATDANINFIKSLAVVQDYERVDSAWMLRKDKLVIDFIPQDNAIGIYGRKTTSYKNFKINKPLPLGFYKNSDDLVVDDEALKKDEKFWKQSRHDTLSKNEAAIYKMVDTIQSLPIYHTWVDIVTLLVSGYKTFHYFDIGPYFSLVSFNDVEGLRLRFGGRTSDKFSKWYQIEGYTAYGTIDRQYKYNMAFKTFLSKKPRIMAGVSYKNDYEVLGQTPTPLNQDNILSSAFGARSSKNMTAMERTEAFYEQEAFPGFSNKIQFSNKVFSPIFGQKYLFNPLSNRIDEHDYINTSELIFTSRFAYHEKYIGEGFKRISVRSKAPVLTAQYTLGVSGVFGSEYDYHKVILTLDDRIYLTPFGYTNYVIQAGQVFGKLPYPLLLIHPGNETLIYDYTSYNLMNFLEFVSDRYVSIAVSHYFDGFFFNKVPLFRRLKWREVFSTKAVLGHLNPKNLEVTTLPKGLGTLNQGPYAEVGAGIENIFKLFRFDAFWRLTYLDNPNISRFGIRGSMQLKF